MSEHYLDDSTVHAFWDNSLAPRLEIDSGDTVVFKCREASDGQIGPDSTAESLAAMDGSRIHPLTGPVLVREAAAGHTLEVEVLSLEHENWGWNGHIPDFGLLAGDFDSHFLQHWRIDDQTCQFADIDRVAVPYEPFCGVMGVAPREPGRLDTKPPRANAGNVDIRGLGVGSRVFLPVLVEGALFSTADCHAAQGDGEVSGIAIEAPMRVALRFTLRTDLQINELQFSTPGPLTRADASGYHCTTAHGPDLYRCAQDALRYMLEWLEANCSLTRSQAYVLCSAAADLKISEIVDAPNWIVACYFPLGVLTG